MISPDGSGAFPLFSGLWYSKRVSPASDYRDGPNGLVIPMGAALTTATRKARAGSLPLVDASRNFFVEFDAAISGKNPDHFPALWMMPVQHSGREEDRIADGTQSWTEIDIDEGGFSPGAFGNVLTWRGKFPKYAKTTYRPTISNSDFDRTRFHRFGFSYVADTHTATWWLDGRPGGPVVIPPLPAHQYYLIMSAQSHGKNVPYTMTIRRIRSCLADGA
jgi:hypothetical protein